MSENELSSNASESHLFGSTKHENIFCALLLLITCSLGVLVNLLPAVVLLRLRVFNNAFGMLAAFNALSNCAVLAHFVLWSSPGIYFGIPESFQPANHLSGQTSLFFYFNCLHATLLISWNRFIAIFSPTAYRRYFTQSNTKLAIFLILIVSILYFCVYFFDACDFHFDSSTMIWSFGNDNCSQWIAKNIDLRYGVSAFGLSALVDILTLIQLHAANMKLVHVRHSNGQKESDASKNQRREIIFFFQSVANTVCYCLMLVCFHIISYWPIIASSRFASFLFTTYVWGAAHTSSGFILIIFNNEIRKRVLRPQDLLRSETLSRKFTPVPPSVITVSAVPVNQQKKVNTFTATYG